METMYLCDRSEECKSTICLHKKLHTHLPLCPKLLCSHVKGHRMCTKAKIHQIAAMRLLQGKEAFYFDVHKRQLSGGE